MEKVLAHLMTRWPHGRRRRIRLGKTILFAKTAGHTADVYRRALLTPTIRSLVVKDASFSPRQRLQDGLKRNSLIDSLSNKDEEPTPRNLGGHGLTPKSKSPRS